MGLSVNAKWATVLCGAVAWLSAVSIAQPHRRALDWHSDLTLWRSAVSVSPEKPRALLNCGNALAEHGDLAAAEGLWYRAWLSGFDRERPWRDRLQVLAASQSNLSVVAAARGDMVTANALRSGALELLRQMNLQ